MLCVFEIRDVCVCVFFFLWLVANNIRLRLRSIAVIDRSIDRSQRQQQQRRDDEK